MEWGGARPTKTKKQKKQASRQPPPDHNQVMEWRNGRAAGCARGACLRLWEGGGTRALGQRRTKWAHSCCGGGRLLQHGVRAHLGVPVGAPHERLFTVPKLGTVSPAQHPLAEGDKPTFNPELGWVPEWRK